MSLVAAQVEAAARRLRGVLVETPLIGGVILPGFDVTPGLHTIFVKGVPYGGSFVGSYSLTPVPEANALMLGLAGLGAVGFAASRRGRRS